jgi:hypothetical protein
MNDATNADCHEGKRARCFIQAVQVGALVTRETPDAAGRRAGHGLLLHAGQRAAVESNRLSAARGRCKKSFGGIAAHWEKTRQPAVCEWIHRTSFQRALRLHCLKLNDPTGAV